MESRHRRGFRNLCVEVQGEQVFHYNSDGVVSSESIVLSATEHGTSSTQGNREWQYRNDGEWQTIIGEDGMHLTIRHDSPLWEDRRTLTIRYLVQENYFGMTPCWRCAKKKYEKEAETPDA